MTMRSLRTLALFFNGVFLGVTLLVLLDGRSTSADHTCAGGPAVCGQNSKLIPFHKDAIGATLLWGASSKAGMKASECPEMLIWMRPAEYKPQDYLNPTVDGMFSGFNENYQNLVQGVNRGGPS